MYIWIQFFGARIGLERRLKKYELKVAFLILLQIAEPQQAQNIVREHVKNPDWVIDGNQWVPLKKITHPLATDIICRSFCYLSVYSSRIETFFLKGSNLLFTYGYIVFFPEPLKKPGQNRGHSTRIS